MPARRQPPLRLRRLGGVLARLRKDAGFSLADVVEATGIDRTTLYRIETGQARPQRRTLAALLDKYNVPDGDRDSLFALARRSAGARPAPAGRPRQLSPRTRPASRGRR